MPLSPREKELISIGASVATGCKPCTDYHFKKVREVGASDEEIRQAISDAISVRNSAQEIMESHGLKQLGISKDVDDRIAAGENTRIRELVSVAAAFAVNCTTNLEKHIAASQTVGISDDEIRSVLDTALFIKGEAAHYVDQIVKLEKKNVELQQLLEELQRTQAQLVQSEKMAALGRMIAGVVHEMNTPLGAINSATDLFDRSVDNILDVIGTSRTFDEIKTSRLLQESLSVIQSSKPAAVQASERITEILNSLKQFIRLDEAPFQQSDLHEGLESTLTLLENELGNRIEVIREYGRIPLISCYPDELNQVFMNLLMNAIQAIEGKGTVTIRSFAEHESIRIQVEDTGTGISPERIPRLFEPAFAERGSRVKAGLGLLVSRNIIQKHKGELEVDSEIGKGSTFTITLPTSLKEESKVPKTEGSDTAAARCSRLET